MLCSWAACRGAPEGPACLPACPAHRRSTTAAHLPPRRPLRARPQRSARRARLRSSAPHALCVPRPTTAAHLLLPPALLQRTPRSFVEQRGTSLVWNYKYAGEWQAAQLPAARRTHTLVARRRVVCASACVAAPEPGGAASCRRPDSLGLRCARCVPLACAEQGGHPARPCRRVPPCRSRGGALPHPCPPLPALPAPAHPCPPCPPLPTHPPFRRRVWAHPGPRPAAAPADRTHQQRTRRHRAGEPDQAKVLCVHSVCVWWCCPASVLSRRPTNQLPVPVQTVSPSSRLSTK